MTGSSAGCLFLLLVALPAALPQCVNILYTSGWTPAYIYYTIGTWTSGSCSGLNCTWTTAPYTPTSTAGVQFFAVATSTQRLTFLNNNGLGAWDNAPTPDTGFSNGNNYFVPAGSNGVFSLASGTLTLQPGLAPSCPVPAPTTALTSGVRYVGRAGCLYTLRLQGGAGGGGWFGQGIGGVGAIFSVSFYSDGLTPFTANVSSGGASSGGCGSAGGGATGVVLLSTPPSVLAVAGGGGRGGVQGHGGRCGRAGRGCGQWHQL